MRDIQLNKFDIGYAFDAAPDDPSFVLPNMLPGTVGSLVSPGGAGKSMLALQLAVYLCGGPDFLQLETRKSKPGKVSYFPAEDPEYALHSRMHAIGSSLEPGQKKAVRELLSIYPLLGERPDVLSDKWMETLKRSAEGQQLVILDTMRRFHTEEENHSGPMAKVLASLEDIAKSSGAAIVFLHHTNKGSAFSGTGDQQHASRGSSVLTDNVRWQGYLAKMSKPEAENYGVTDTQRHYFVRFGISKANYGKPFPERWLRRHEGGVLKPAVLKNPKVKHRDRA